MQGRVQGFLSRRSWRRPRECLRGRPRSSNCLLQTRSALSEAPDVFTAKRLKRAGKGQLKGGPPSDKGRIRSWGEAELFSGPNQESTQQSGVTLEVYSTTSAGFGTWSRAYRLGPAEHGREKLRKHSGTEALKA